ncbi:major facilitator superfamily domain-containing protein 6-like [Amphiura filiformis]|uniref:major facilitator superfamily domain-containing protein 6-like n=1 Tax=Amphiura filiformis TaxID=82378 RepID=UPI003B212E87
MVLLVLLPASVMKFPAHRRPRAMYRNVGTLFSQIEFLAFLLAAFTSGFSLGAFNTFLFIFIRDLGGPHVLMGLNITITALSEAVCLYFSSQAIQKLGHKNILNLVVFCYGLRHILYSVIYNPWLSAPVGMLHGICFGLFWPTCTSYVNIVSPTGMEASVQSIAHSVYFGLGRGLGMIVGGVIFHTFGSRNMFRFFTVFCSIVLLLLGLVQGFTWARRRRPLTLSVQYEEI